MERMSQEFREWYEEETGWDIEEAPNHDVTEILWLAWQASREAVEIELPNGVTTREALDAGYMGDYAAGVDDGIEGCANAIRAAGLKVKGE